MLSIAHLWESMVFDCIPCQLAEQLSVDAVNITRLTRFGIRRID